MTSRMMLRVPRSHAGFTLLEMAIVLFILGLLLAGLIGPVEVQLEARDRARTQAYMQQVQEALYGYALTNRRLPCPDTDGDGLPNPVPPASTGCNAAGGQLPWAELGVEPGDAWGNVLDYRVRAPNFTWPDQDHLCNGDAQGEFDLCTTGNIQLFTRGDDPATAGVSEGKFRFPAATDDNVAAVIVSHGRNGYGAIAVNGIARGAVPSENADEAENADGNATFITRAYSRGEHACVDDDNEGSPLCEFDDLVMAVTRTILNARMVAAGRLP